MMRAVMNPRVLNGLIVASAMLSIAASSWALDSRVLLIGFKPLTTLLILLRAWPRGADARSARRALRLGLMLSLLGDVVLLWPEQGFLPGLVAFLWSFIPAALRIPVACYVLALTAMSAQTAVVGLASQGDDRRRGRLLMLGGALFMTSDALLATNRFAHALPAATLWILGTYWAAQWCIASWLKPATPAPT